MLTALRRSNPLSLMLLIHDPLFLSRIMVPQSAARR
jgi:hypothetical protein